MIETLVTPVGIATLVAPAKDQKADSVSGWHLMFSSDIKVRREGISTFDFSSVREREVTPILRFSREGLTWRLVGLQLPKELLATQLGNISKGSEPTASYNPKWEFRERRDPMDDTVSIVLSRGADEEVKTRFSSVRPTLIFRCRERKFEAFINVGGSVEYDYQTHSANVRLRFDNKPANRETWGVSDNREAVFASNPGAFWGYLRNATSMQFEWTPSGGSATVAKFTKGDLEAHATRFANGCGKRELLGQTLQEPIGAPANAQQYMVPAGAYADPSDVIKKLASANVPYYIEPIQTKQGSVTRLRAGPFPSREAAETALAQLRNLGLRPGNVAAIP